MQNPEEIRTAALGYIAQGFSIIPVGKDKAPLLKTWTEFQSRIATVDEVEGWFKQYGAAMQIGIVTGKVSGITVIDVESGGYWNDLPETVIAKTGGDGRHYYYCYTDIKNAVKLWPLTDIKSEGGYVVAAPSVSTKGSYVWLQPLQRDVLATFPTQLYQEKIRRWKGLCRDYKGVAIGCRHDSMVSRVGKLLALMPEHAWETEVWVQFQQDNRNNHPPIEEDELRKIFDDISKKEKQKRQSNQNTYSTPTASTQGLVLHSCAEILATVHRPDSFVIDRLIPEGMVTALTSQAGVGKSIIALEMAHCIAAGTPFLGQFKTKQMSVLLLDQEMSPNTIVGRFHSLISNADLPIFTTYETFLKITSPDDYSKIVSAVTEKHIGLLILDTLVTFHGGDENQVNEMRQVMEAMMRLCADTGATILFLHHQRKGAYGEQASQASMRGSTEIAAKIGCQITLESHGKEVDEATGEITMKLTLEQHKSRLPSGFRKFCVKSIYNENTRKSLITYDGECEGKKAKKDIQKDEVTKLLSIVPGSKMSRKEIIGKLGAAKNTDKAIADMVTDGLVVADKQPGSKERLYSLATLAQPEIEF